jgi:stringent starvation protein B
MLMSSRPYLVQAMFDWILDNGLTPFLMIDATVEGVCVPRHLVVDNEIVINLSPQAVSHFVMNKEYIQLKARFTARVEEIYAPMHAIKALYTKETMSGVGFTPEGAPYFAGDVTGVAHLQQSKLHEKTEYNSSVSKPQKATSHLKLVSDHLKDSE